MCKNRIIFTLTSSTACFTRTGGIGLANTPSEFALLLDGVFFKRDISTVLYFTID